MQVCAANSDEENTLVALGVPELFPLRMGVLIGSDALINLRLMSRKLMMSRRPIFLLTRRLEREQWLQETEIGLKVTIPVERNGTRLTPTKPCSIYSFVVISTWTRWTPTHATPTYARHKRYDQEYVPLQWSPALMRESRTWAEKLARDCTLVHDQNSKYGENIALNYGSGGYAQMRPTENILTREFRQDECFKSCCCFLLLSLSAFLRWVHR